MERASYSPELISLFFRHTHSISTLHIIVNIKDIELSLLIDTELIDIESFQ